MFLSPAPKNLGMAPVAESSSSFQPLISVMAANAAKTVKYSLKVPAWETTCEAPRSGHVGCEWRKEDKLGIHYTVRLVHVLDPTPFRREKNARTPDRSGFQSIAALAQFHLSSRFSTHDGPSKKSVTARLFVCVHVCDTCLCVSACGWPAIRCVHHCFRCVR